MPSQNNKNKKMKLIHPFLVAIFPVLIIYSQNIGRVNVEELVLPMILIIALSIGIFYLAKLILKNANKSALIVTIILIILFSYGHIYYLLNDVSIDGFDIGRNLYLIPAFGLVLGVGIYFVARANRVFDNATSILNVISIVFVLVAVSNVGLVAAEISSCEFCANQELFYHPIDFSSYFGTHIFSITENGFGKRTSHYEFRVTNRGGKGIIGIVNSERNGNVSSSFPVNEGDEILISTNKGRVIRVAVKEIRVAGRNTQGVRIIKLSGDEKVVSSIKLDDNLI